MRAVRALIGFVVLATVTGCAPRDPLEQVVSAPTLSRLSSWRARIASDASAGTRARVEEALQEIRLSYAGERELKRQLDERVVSGTEVIDEAVRKRVDGQRLRDVLRTGYGLRVRRLKEELAGLEDAMKQNSRLVTRPGDLESQHHLEGLRDRQLVRVQKYREDLAAAERELESLEQRGS
jgi:hypothetical protein